MKDKDEKGHHLTQLMTVGLPESFYIGVARGEGDCFFDSVAQCLNERLLKDKAVSVKSLRALCKSYAESVLENGDVSTMKLVTGIGYDTLQAYANEIELTADDVPTGSYARWGRPEVEGAIICKRYKVKLHVVERQLCDGNEVWCHEIVSENGPKSTCKIDYTDKKLLHIINRGDSHFDPILRHRTQVFPLHLQHLGDKFKLESKQIDEGLRRLNIFRPPKEQTSLSNNSGHTKNGDEQQGDNLNILQTYSTTLYNNVSQTWRDNPEKGKRKSIQEFCEEYLATGTNYPAEPTDDKDGLNAFYSEMLNLEMLKGLFQRWPRWPFEDLRLEGIDENNSLDTICQQLGLEISSISSQMSSFLQDELEFRCFLSHVANLIQVTQEMESGVVSGRYCVKVIDTLVQTVKSLSRYEDYFSKRPASDQVCHYRLRLLLFYKIGKTLEILFKYCPKEGTPSSSSPVPPLKETFTALDTIVTQLIIPLFQFHRVLFLQEQASMAHRKLVLNRQQDNDAESISQELSNWFVKQKMLITGQSAILCQLSQELLRFRQRFNDVDDITYEDLNSNGQEPLPEFLFELKVFNAAYQILRYVDVTSSIDQNEQLPFQTAMLDSIGWTVNDFLKFVTKNLKEPHQDLLKYLADVESNEGSKPTALELKVLGIKIAKFCSELWLSWKASADYASSFLDIENVVTNFVEKVTESLSIPVRVVEHDTSDNCLKYLNVTAISEILHFDAIPRDIGKKLGEKWIFQMDEDEISKTNSFQQAPVMITESGFRNTLTSMRELLIDDKGKLIAAEALLQKCQQYEKLETVLELLVLQLVNIMKHQASNETFWYFNRLMNRSVELIFPQKSNMDSNISGDLWRGLLPRDLQTKATVARALVWMMEFEALITMKYIFEIHGGRQFLLNALYSVNDDDTAWRKMKNHYSKLLDDIITTESRFWTDERWRKILMSILQHANGNLWSDSNVYYEMVRAIFQQELFDAASAGDVQMVEFCFDRGVRPNSISSKGETTLHLATRRRHINVVESLLKSNKVDISAADNDGNTSLHLATLLGDTNAIEILIKSGAKINASNEGGLTALHLSCWRGDVVLLKKLLFSGADIEAATSNGFTSLFFAIDHLAVVKELLELKVNVNARCKTNSTPLHEATTRLGTNESLKLLLQNGANIHLLDNGYGTPLHLAIQRGNVDAALILLEHGSEMNLVCSSGLSIVHHAAQRGHLEILKRLLERGGIVNEIGVRSVTPIHLAAYNGHLECVKVLVEHGANVKAATDDGWTPYHCAATKDHQEIVDVLLNAGATPQRSDNAKKDWMLGELETKNTTFDNTVNLPDRLVVESTVDAETRVKEQTSHNSETTISQMNSGVLKSVTPMQLSDDKDWSKLHFLVIQDSCDKAMESLRDGADVNARGPQNLTPLHLACQMGFPKMVELLLEKGADLNAVSGVSKQSALHFAVQRGHLSVVRQLLSAGSDVNAIDANCNSCFHLAVLGDNIAVVTMLLDSQANTDVRNGEGKTPLHLAVTGGNLKIVQLLVRRNANVGAVDEKGCTPLHLAMETGKCAIGTILLTAGGTRHEVNLKNLDNWTPLHLAALLGDVRLLGLMIDKGGNVDITGKDGYGPLHVGTSAGFVQVVRLLLKNKANANLTDHNLQTPLHLAIKSGHVPILKLLLEHDADVNASDVNDFTPLLLAIQKGDLDVVEVLLENGADLEAYCPKYSVTPLFAALASGRVEIVRALLQKGAHVNNVYIKGRVSPLRYATSLGDVQLVEILIQGGANMNAGDAQNNTPLHVAAREGLREVVETLVKAGAYVDALNDHNRAPLYEAVENGHTIIASTLLRSGAIVLNPVLGREYSILHQACRSGDSDLVELLIDRGADINSAANVDSVTPLHVACQSSLVDIVKVLLKRGAEPNSKNGKMVTALYIAAESGALDVVQLLLTGGANHSLKDDNNSTPLHAACRRRDNKGVLALLLASGADVNCVDKNFWTPLHYASREGDANMVQMLLDNGADVKSPTWNGTTPLHISAAHGHLYIVRRLLKHGANCKAKTVDGLTPLYAAAVEGHVEVVNELLLSGADVNTAKPSTRWTALHVAALEGYLDVVIALLDKGAIVDSHLNDGSTPLCLASHAGHAEVVAVLLKHNASVFPSTAKCNLLHAAVRGNDDKTLKLILNKMAEKPKTEFLNCLEARDRLGNTAMMRAARLGMMVSVDTLLKYGADVNAKNSNGMTALHLAAQKGKAEMIDLLATYDNMTVLDATDQNGNTALHVAVLNKHITAVTSLIACKANLSIGNATGKTPLHLAAEQGNDEIVRELLRAGAPVNCSDKMNSTPLHLAAMKGRCSTAECLLEGGALLDSCAQEGITPLYVAAESGHIPMVLLLLKKGRAQMRYNSCPSILHACVCSGNASLLRAVLMTLNQDVSVDLPIDAPDKYGDTPLMWACEGGFLEAAKILLSFGANCNATNKEGMTPLHWAAKKGYDNLVRLLLRYGVSHESKDIHGRTPLDLVEIEMGKTTSADNLGISQPVVNLLGKQQTAKSEETLKTAF